MCTDDFEDAFLIDLTASIRNAQNLCSGKILTRERILSLEDSLWLALVDNFPTVFAGAWPNINQPIGLPNGVFIMFDHDERVADIAQTLESLNQSMVISLVQANGRLIKNVKHAC